MYKNLNMRLWIYQLDEDSVNNASLEMKTSLGLEEAKTIKEFTFSP